MDKKFDKPFKTISQQISLISERNVLIDESDFVKEALNSVSYYTLMNGYKASFLSHNNSDKFKDGTSFTMIYSLHWLDVSLSNILFKYILLIEKSLKTKLSYYVGDKIGIDKNDYLEDFRNYANPNGSRNGILNDLKDVIRNPKKDTVTAYYASNKNHIPPWILVNDIPFGLSLKWYSLLKDPGKKFVTNEFIGQFDTLSLEERKELLSKCLEILRSFRNKVAHGSRTFNLCLKEELPKNSLLKICPPEVLSELEYNGGSCKNDIFSVLFSIIFLTNDKFVLNNLIMDLNAFFYPYIEHEVLYLDKDVFQLFKLPNNILQRLEQFIKEKPEKKYSCI